MLRRPQPWSTTKQTKKKFRRKRASCVMVILLPLALLLWLYFVLVSITKITYPKKKKNQQHIHDPMGSIRMGVSGSTTSRGGGSATIIKSPNEKKDSSTTSTTTKATTKTTTKRQESSSPSLIQKYWRYDQASPRIIVQEGSSSSSSSRTLQLPSVPRQHRLGMQAIQNITEYTLHAENVFPQREYYFDYNPSIIRLPSSSYTHTQKFRIPGGNNEEEASETVAADSYYLASFRVSNQNYCFHPEDRQRLMMGSTTTTNATTTTTAIIHKDWLGLALLSAKNLDILVDGVVNVQQIPGFGRSAQDFRLFVLPNSNNNNHKNNNNNEDQSSSSPSPFQIYLSSNDVIVPLWVTLPAPAAAAAANVTALTILAPPPRNVNATRIPQVFGKLEAWIRPFVSCATCRRGGGGAGKNNNKRTTSCGKNFNYFVGNVKNNDKTMTAAAAFCEVWPSPPHLVRSINLTRPCQRGGGPSLQLLESESSHNDYEWSSSSSTTSIIVPSFATVEQSWFSDATTTAGEAAAANQNNRGQHQQQQQQQQPNKFLTRGRGSACCIDIISSSNDSSSSSINNKRQRLWMGMEHSKTLPSRSSRGGQQPNHYLSRLYAFEQEAPFAIVARSGYFCLGFPSPSEQQQQQQHDEEDEIPPLVQVTAWRKLILGNPNQTTRTSGGTFEENDAALVFDCPRIHFVSGMTIDATNSSLVIIAYGVNDCLSRFVRVQLDDLKQLLFTGPPAVVTSSTEKKLMHVSTRTSCMLSNNSRL